MPRSVPDLHEGTVSPEIHPHKASRNPDLRLIFRWIIVRKGFSAAHNSTCLLARVKPV
jgi:hypothetical protein